MAGPALLFLIMIARWTSAKTIKKLKKKCLLLTEDKQYYKINSTSKGNTVRLRGEGSGRERTWGSVFTGTQGRGM